jgi:hypothetical protein
MTSYIIRTFLGNGHDLIKEIGVNSDHFLDRKVGNDPHIWKAKRLKKPIYSKSLLEQERERG